MASEAELAAGRELDERVACHVMGWCFREQSEYEGVMYRYYDLPDGSNAGAHVRIPYYSTDIHAAWKVVDKMHPHALHLWAPGALINDEFGTYAKQWTAQFVAWPKRAPDGGVVGTNPPNWYGPEVEAETAPLAICRAALQVVGGGSFLKEEHTA